MEAYLDNSATTVPFPCVRDIMIRTLSADFGNPSSMHKKGFEAEQYVKNAAAAIAKTLKVSEKEIVFTSGGTESNNMALIGGALANRRRGMHLITTRIEHASVGNPMRFLEEMGFEITYLTVDKEGRVNLEELKNSLRDDTILVSVMHVNNEIGAVEPIAQIGKIVHDKSKEILFHVDAIQSYGKFQIRPKKMGIDLLSVSGHKIHGPKGIGFLYIRDKAKIKPIIQGGGQQRDMRSGTENVPGIAGLGAAAAEIYSDFSKHIEWLYHLKHVLIDDLEDLEGVVYNGMPLDEAAPHIVSLSFRGIRSEVLLHALEEKGVYVSAGSACSSNHPAISGTLRNIGVESDLLDSTIRISFSVMTSEEEVHYAAQTIKELVPRLRKYVRS